MAQVRVRKRGQTWSYVFEAGKTETGKRKVVEKGGFLTKEAAYDAGIAAYTDWKHGNIGITSQNITVNTFLRNWLDNVVSLNVRPTTISSYEIANRNWIKPHFNGVMLKDLTPILLDQWTRTLAKSGLARNSIRNAYVLLRQALDYAVYPSKLIPSNPANYIKLPRSVPTDTIKRVVISRETFSQLIDKYPFGTPLHVPLLLLYHTGMRRGEVVGLSWDDVDLNQHTITVNQQIIYPPTKKNKYFAPLKTRSSNRKFVIDTVLVKTLREWKGQQEYNEQEHGDSYVYIYSDEKHDRRMYQMSKDFQPQDGWKRVPIVCTWNTGKAVSSHYIAERLAREKLNAHSFRHTHATDLIENGATPKGVAGRLGHQNAVITQNLYTHNTEKLQKDTALIFEKMMQTKPICRQNADNEER